MTILIKREIVGRYKGSFLGLLWSFFHPVFMLIIYTFVFSVIFKARWGLVANSQPRFALILFCGLLVFNILSETLNKAPSLIASNVSYVKKVVFPLEVLPCVIAGAAVFHAAVGFSVWLIFYVFILGIPPVTAIFLPFILLPLLLYTLGFAWVLASLGVYLRDVAQIVGVATTALMFLSPIFFPLSAIPEPYKGLIRLNPLTGLIEQTRDVLIWGSAPDIYALFLSILMSAAVAWLGFAWFQRTRKGFADVL